MFTLSNLITQFKDARPQSTPPHIPQTTHIDDIFKLQLKKNTFLE